GGPRALPAGASTGTARSASSRAHGAQLREVADPLLKRRRPGPIGAIRYPRAARGARAHAETPSATARARSTPVRRECRHVGGAFDVARLAAQPRPRYATCPTRTRSFRDSRFASLDELLGYYRTSPDQTVVFRGPSRKLDLFRRQNRGPRFRLARA